MKIFYRVSLLVFVSASAVFPSLFVAASSDNILHASALNTSQLLEQLSAVDFQRSELFPLMWNVQFQGQHVTFKHRQTGLIHASVCVKLRHDLKQLKRCKQAAKGLFLNLCYHTRSAKGEGGYNEDVRTLFCSAANSYEGKVSRFYKAEQVDKVELIRQQACAAWRIKAMTYPVFEVLRERDRICLVAEKK